MFYPSKDAKLMSYVKGTFLLLHNPVSLKEQMSRQGLQTQGILVSTVLCMK